MKENKKKKKKKKNNHCVHKKFSHYYLNINLTKMYKRFYNFNVLMYIFSLMYRSFFLCSFLKSIELSDTK